MARRKVSRQQQERLMKRRREGVESVENSAKRVKNQNPSPLVLCEGVFQSTVKSVGGSVKDKKCVLATQLKKCGRHPPNINCRVETFGKMVAHFEEKERRWVNEMGFGGLLWLRGRGLPRNLCYWLMSLFDPLRKVMLFPGGVKYPIHKTQVHWVFGLPHGPKSVPTEVRGEMMKEIVCKFESEYGDWVELKGKLHRVVDIGKVRNRMEMGWAEEDEKDFKFAFLMLVLGDILCPTQCTRLSKGLYAAVCVALSSNGYDWCQLVVDNLVVSGKRFANKFYPSGYSKGAGGCSYFLAILYLDHLNRTPVDWGVYPRVRVWTTKLVNEARGEDRYEDRGDYGKLGCLGVPYGKTHPLMPEDTMGPEASACSMALEVANLVVSRMVNPSGYGAVPSNPGYAIYVHDESVDVDEGVGVKRRRTGPKDVTRYFQRRGLSDDVLALLSETEMTSGSDDDDWVRSIDGESEASEEESCVNSDELRQLEEEVDNDWVADSSECVSTTEESVVDSAENLADNVGNVEEEDNVEVDKVVEEEENVEEETVEEEKVEEEEEVVVEEEEEVVVEVVVEGEEEVVVEEEENVEEEKVEEEKVDEEEVVEEEKVDEPYPPQPVANSTSLNVDEFDEVDQVVIGVCSQVMTQFGDGETTPPPSPNVAQQNITDQVVGQPNSDGCMTPVKVKKSRKRRSKKLSCKLKDSEFETIMIPRQHVQMRNKIVKFLRRCPTRFKSQVLLRCGDQEASVSNCRSMLCENGGVDDNYIRVICKINMCSWKAKFQGSVRAMLDPTLAIRLLSEKSEDPEEWISTKRLAKICAKPFVEEGSANRVFVAFVPILEGGHWWCAGYCVNSEEVWLMDSASRSPVAEHASVLKKLDFVMDKFFSSFDEEWVIGKLANWPRRVVKVEHQEDGYSCGIYMLGAIEKCAERFQEEFSFVGDIVDEREWLLTAHLMSDFNEAKVSMKEIVGAETGGSDE